MILRPVGVLRSEMAVARHIKFEIKLREAFRLIRMGQISLRLGFHGFNDFDTIRILKWDNFDHDGVIIKQWNKDDNIIKDVLSTDGTHHILS